MVNWPQSLLAQKRFLLSIQCSLNLLNFGQNYTTSKKTNNEQNIPCGEEEMHQWVFKASDSAWFVQLRQLSEGESNMLMVVTRDRFIGQCFSETYLYS